MANTARPFGLRPVRYLNGTPWNGKGRQYWVPATYATAIYIGDPVVIVGDSNDVEVQGHIPGSLSEVNIGVAGDDTPITGVCVGILPDTRDSALYRAASVATVIYVCDDPNVVYQIQDDGGGSPDADWVGLNANLIAGAGNAYTGQSGWALDGGTSDGPAADASNQLTILALSNIADNELGDYAVWDVLINQQTYRPASGLGVA